MSSNCAIRVFGFHAAASEDDELHHFGEFTKAVPRREAADIVFSDEIEQLHVRLALAERLDCIDGIGRRRTPEFHRIKGKTRLTFDRSAQHFQTDIGRRQLLSQFVGRSSSRNKDNGFKVERFEGFARQDQVTVMDRIEGATENADLFQAKRLFGDASTALCHFGWVNRGLDRMGQRESRPYMAGKTNMLSWTL